MRKFSLILLAPLLALAGCACQEPITEPVVEIRSPLWMKNKPLMEEQGWAIRARAAAACQQTELRALPYTTAPAAQYRYAALPQAHAAEPCAPFSPPPVPPPIDPNEPPESIPATK